jgi:hypothetical protein
MTPTDAFTLPPTPPWWRFPIVWFALSGPMLVVAASFTTMAIAYRHADVELVETTAATTARTGARTDASAPALQARNHAATPPARP